MRISIEHVAWPRSSTSSAAALFNHMVRDSMKVCFLSPELSVPDTC